MMPAGSQSPHSMRVLRVLPTILARSHVTASTRYCVDMLPRRHAQRAVEANDFAIEVAVLDHVPHQRRILRRLAEQLWKRHRGGEALLRLFGQGMQHRGGEDS